MCDWPIWNLHSNFLFFGGGLSAWLLQRKWSLPQHLRWLAGLRICSHLCPSVSSPDMYHCVWDLGIVFQIKIIPQKWLNIWQAMLIILFPFKSVLQFLAIALHNFQKYSMWKKKKDPPIMGLEIFFNWNDTSGCACQSPTVSPPSLSLNDIQPLEHNPTNKQVNGSTTT